MLREILRRVELSTTSAADEHQRLKHVTLVPQRGARIRVRAISDVPAISQPAAVQERECPAARRS